MLSATEFTALFEGRHPTQLNDQQRDCIHAPPSAPLLIIAGPGSGKTTVMVLRALRHLLVDGMLPEQVVITTFTKKAAQEVRTRWLDWGLPLIESAKTHPSLQSPEAQAHLAQLDLNRCITGTLDSICETLLGDFRPAGTISPVLIEGYPANQRLMRSGLQETYRNHQDPIDTYFAPFSFGGQPPRTQADMLGVARTITDRFVHDRIDLVAFRAAASSRDARVLIADAHEAYCQALQADSQLDFALLEHEFLTRMEAGLLDEAVLPWQAVLVDEYQDTNPLQEAIYFEMARRSHAALSVVGDDDQSLYRFRGATVELFTQFVARLRDAIGADAVTKYLFQNYRSTPEIVAFFNDFVAGDTGFAGARIQPPKPAIRAARASTGIPVLGMFRDSQEALAHSLSQFLMDVFRGGGCDIPTGTGGTTRIARHPNGGDFGDAVMLSHSVGEFKRSFGGNPPEPRLPFLLRNELLARDIGVFNPRGQALSDQPSVQVLLGLLLECLDRSSVAHPDGELTPNVLGLTNVARTKLRDWRTHAHNFIQQRPAPGGLLEFVEAWASRRSQSAGTWPEDWPILELLFKLLTWLPAFQTDPEHQVWLEAISRAMAQSRLFSPYGGSILNQDRHVAHSRQSIIRDILRPIAEGMIDVDEELIPSVPRDRFPIMTIHQSKGLEFPLVIVDISSGYKQNHRLNAGMRFPDQPSSVTELENDLAPFTAVGASRCARSALDRSFDDLMRLYYVAYSRPQTALLLIGHEKTIATRSTVRTLASGWCRDGSWRWHDAANRTTFANRLPMVLI